MVLSSQPIVNTKIKILCTGRPKHSVFPLQTFRVHVKSKGNIVNACSHVWRALSIVKSIALDYSLLPEEPPPNIYSDACCIEMVKSDTGM